MRAWGLASGSSQWSDGVVPSGCVCHHETSNKETKQQRRYPPSTATMLCVRVSRTCASQMQVGCRPPPLWWRRPNVPQPLTRRILHVSVGLSATAESEQESEWRPRRASEWICEDIRPTDVRISMGPTADNEVACGTCGGYHFPHQCPLAALVRAQGESCHLRQAQLFPEEGAKNEEDAEQDRHGRGDTPYTVSAAAALLQLQLPVVYGGATTFIYCAAVPLTTPILCAPHTASAQADVLRPLVAPWVLVALGEIATLPDVATTRAALVRMRRQLSQLAGPATALFEVTRGLRPVNGEGYVVEEELMQDHLPVPRVGGTLDASSALVEVLDGMANDEDYPQLRRPPTAWSAFSQGSAATCRGDPNDKATTLPKHRKHNEDDKVPDVVLHWWDRDA